MPQPVRFVLTDVAGTDTLHADPREQCNTDADEGKRVIPRGRALQLMRSGDVHCCRHCKPQEELRSR
jgi:hypothetical protein